MLPDPAATHLTDDQIIARLALSGVRFTGLVEFIRPLTPDERAEYESASAEIARQCAGDFEQFRRRIQEWSKQRGLA